ncbi:MAG TPA: family 10 glycosylhydrolase, partial [Verrucomicrobiae bacterium]|nr:family 10 glycosylhydrolase [Verrucomicrobiae bacterium]
MKLRFVMLIGLALCLQALGAQSPYVRVYRPANIVPPPVPHEFRGAWISVVATNQDWPSKPGLSAQEQKAELVALLDRAVQLHLNAIVFQVRPACDAVYASSIEPWSACLTGIQGNAPEPYYDPLAFAVAEAHKRGLELHAWFNPFRAWHFQSKSPVAPNHISRTHPELVRRYGSQLWLDPGDPEVRNYVDRVVLDVVKRYDIDGVQFDDYFYPYPEKDVEGRPLPFPDEATWKRYGLANGFDLADWRRQNINQFVAKVYHDIKAAKPWVKFGISPFGIWRPENPAPIRGMDAYATLYADSRRWLASGWVDYLAPQL